MVVAGTRAPHEATSPWLHRAARLRPPYHRGFLPERWNTNPAGRNYLLIGAGTLAAVLLIGILGTISFGGDDDEDVPVDTTPLGTTPQPGRTVGHSAIGASIRKPRRWEHRVSGPAITLRSPDKTVLVSISLPRGTDRSAAVLSTGVAAVRRQYRDVRVIGTDPRRVANLPANSVITSAVNSRGTKLRILTSAAQGRTRAWLVQVFSAEGTKERRLAEAQVAIGTLRLTG